MAIRGDQFAAGGLVFFIRHLHQAPYFCTGYIAADSDSIWHGHCDSHMYVAATSTATATEQPSRRKNLQQLTPQLGSSCCGHSERASFALTIEARSPALRFLHPNPIPIRLLSTIKFHRCSCALWARLH